MPDSGLYSQGKNHSGEKALYSQFHVPADTTRIVQAAKEHYSKLLEPAGRFKMPLSAFDALPLELRSRIEDLSGGESGLIFADPTYPVPSQWQLIVNYLYAHGGLASPRVIFEPFPNDVPKIYSLRLISTLEGTATDGSTNINSGHSRGVSPDLEEALSKVIGEFLERYPLLLYRTKDLLRSTTSALTRRGQAFLDPSKLAGFAEWQKTLFPRRKFDENSIFNWVWGEELLSKKRVLIPAQLIFWNYQVNFDSEEPYLRQPITNGAAGHFSREEAILGGIYENIQRDAFLIHWLNFIVPPRVDIASIKDRTLRGLIQSFSRCKFEVIFLNTTLDLAVPSCICVLVDHSGIGPKVAVGGGCGWNYEHALLRSLTEAIGVYIWLRMTMEKAPFHLRKEGYEPFRDRSVGQSERLLLWGDKEMFSFLEPFLSGTMQSVQEIQDKFSRTFTSAQEELNYVCESFRSKGAGYEIFMYDAHHELLDALRYHSVKVVIPALLPLYLRESDAPLGSRRLRDVPNALGLKVAENLTPWPHPFP